MTILDLLDEVAGGQKKRIKATPRLVKDAIAEWNNRNPSRQMRVAIQTYDDGWIQLVRVFRVAGYFVIPENIPDYAKVSYNDVYP